MSYKTSLESRSSRLCLILLLSVLTMGHMPLEKAPEAAVLSSRVVTRLPLATTARPRWARFSSAEVGAMFLVIDDRGVVASLPQGTIRPIPEGNLPVGWLGGSLVVREPRGQFHLLDLETLSPTTRFAAGLVPLPRAYGKGSQLVFTGVLSEKAASTPIPSVIPGADVEELSLITRREGPSFSVAKDEDNKLHDAHGQVVFEAAKKIYGIAASPDRNRLILYFGNRDYLLFNRLTRRTVALPVEIERWFWMPDGVTLLGEVTEMVSARYEAIARTDFFVYEPGSELRRIKLPVPVDGTVLRILDVSSDGLILADVERVVPEVEYLGVMVLEVEWQ